MTLTFPGQCTHATGTVTWCVTGGSLVRYSGAACSGSGQTLMTDVTSTTPFSCVAPVGNYPALRVALTVNSGTTTSATASSGTDVIALENAVLTTSSYGGMLMIGRLIRRFLREQDGITLVIAIAAMAILAIATTGVIVAGTANEGTAFVSLAGPLRLRSRATGARVRRGMVYSDVAAGTDPPNDTPQTFPTQPNGATGSYSVHSDRRRNVARHCDRHDAEA